MFHDRSLLGKCFRGFVLPVFEYCSAVWCSAADTLLILLDREVGGARSLTGGVFECDIECVFECDSTLQYSRTFIPFSVSLWNDLANPIFDGVGLAGFKSRANASLLT